MLVFLILSLSHCLGIKSSQEKPKVTSKEGILDLRNWDFYKYGMVELNGDWEYYPEKFDLGENTNEKKPKSFYEFGSKINPNQAYPEYASFRLKILLPENKPELLFFRIAGLNSSYNLYANFKLIAFRGIAGKSKLTTTPSIGSDISQGILDSKEINLILQVSDFYSNKHGFSGKLELGTMSELGSSANLELLTSFGLVLFLSFVFLISITQISERIFLLLSISSIGLIFHISLSYPYPIRVIASKTREDFIYYFRIFNQGLVTICFAYFYYQICEELKSIWAKISITGAFSVFILFLFLSSNYIPPKLEIISSFYLAFTQIVFTYHFFLDGPSSFARIKAYTKKYKAELDRTLGELTDSKKDFDKKIIERSFNMVTYMEKLEIQTGEMEKLNELIIHLLEGANINSVLDEIFSHIMTYYRSNIAFLYFLDPVTNEFFPYRGITKDIPEEIRSFMENSRMPVSREAGVAYIAYKRKKTIYLENAKTKYTRKREKGKGIPELVSSLYIPVLIRNEFQGIFFLATFNHPLNLNKEKIKFISMFTNQLTAAIQKEKLLKEMEEEKRKAEMAREFAEIAKKEAEEAKEEIEAINSLTKSINENLELKYIMDKIMNFVKDHYGIHYYSLHILNDNKKKMKLLEAKFPDHVTSEEKRRVSQIHIPVQDSEGAFPFIFKTKKMIYYKKLNIDKSNEEERESLRNLHISSMVGIPLKVKNEIIGILNFFSPEELSLTKTHLKTIANLGEQVAGVIHNSSLYKDIKVEKDKSEGLLLSILPPKIATELKNTSKVVPIIYESVTILFTDFVGFTKIAETLLPKQLLIELDGYFTFFDFVCEKYNIEKLKTIGDSFMCAGGLPTANKTHAIDACLTAIEFRDFAIRMQELNATSKDEMMPWELRIGLHTGPVIGGIVGTTKFAYDVWGDSVNIASRIESSSVPGRINISETTYELVKDFFICEHRGKVSAKNKGEIRMYFLNRLKPEFSANEEGTAPNQKFYEYYEKIKLGQPIPIQSSSKLRLVV